MTLPIETARFELRRLTTADVNERYLGWLRDPQAERYITAATTTRDLDELRAYVRARVDRPDVLFLAIVDKATGLHVGNIKYEPLDRESGYAVMGLLIGDPEYRGRGVAREVLEASTAWLKVHHGIDEVILTVDAAHDRAIRAYEAAGFAIGSSPHYPASAGVMSMIRRQ
jgi:[ribosomal protein S5]-alanine N-acetyltransferase